MLVTEPLWYFSRAIEWHYSPPLERLCDPGIFRVFRNRVEVPMRWWNPDKDWIASRVQNVRVEARRAVDDEGNPLVVLINHTGDVVEIGSGALPWFESGSRRAMDLTDSWGRSVGESEPITLRVFDVRFYRYVVR